MLKIHLLVLRFSSDAGFHLHAVRFNITHAERESGSGSGAGNAKGQLELLHSRSPKNMTVDLCPRNLTWIFLFCCRGPTCLTISATSINTLKLAFQFISLQRRDTTLTHWRA